MRVSERVSTRTNGIYLGRTGGCGRDPFGTRRRVGDRVARDDSPHRSPTNARARPPSSGKMSFCAIRRLAVEGELSSVRVRIAERFASGTSDRNRRDRVRACVCVRSRDYIDVSKKYKVSNIIIIIFSLYYSELSTKIGKRIAEPVQYCFWKEFRIVEGARSAVTIHTRVFFAFYNGVIFIISLLVVVQSDVYVHATIPI